MAYEETLFPSYFYAKKYYTGRVHTTQYNEHGELFIWGITLVKKKTSKLCKLLGREFLEELLSPSNKKSIEELRSGVYDKLLHGTYDYSFVTGWEVYKA
jgi:hypothetical protein